MDNAFEKTADQAAAFQKIWMDSASKMIQAGFTLGPNSASPELLRQLRNGMFQALSESWEEFLRSPQFLDAMKQCMDTGVAFRKLTSDLLAKTRNEMQAPSRDDIDTVMLNIRHMEKRLLDRIEDLAQEVQQLKTNNHSKTTRVKTRTTSSRSARATRKAGAS